MAAVGAVLSTMVLYVWSLRFLPEPIVAFAALLNLSVIVPFMEVIPKGLESESALPKE